MKPLGHSDWAKFGAKMQHQNASVNATKVKPVGYSDCSEQCWRHLKRRFGSLHREANSDGAVAAEPKTV